MHNIEEISIANYHDNMLFLKTNHEHVYNKIKALEALLEDGRYPQKYDLEYKDEYFDVIELSSKEYLYHQNSKLFSDELTKKTSFKKNDQVIETFYNLNFSDSALEKIKDADALTIYATTAPIINYHDSNVKSSMSMKKIYKFIFLGVGLGLHISGIINKTDAKGILIIENDIELFRLSLFTCNYEKALNGCICSFSIAQNTYEFNQTFNQFYSNSFIWNHYLKFSLFSSQYEAKIKEIQTLILTRPEISYPHEFLLYKNTQLLGRLQKDYKFLQLSKKSSENFFKDKPLLVIGAGPSLHKNIDWLKDNHNNFILIAVFAALKTLYKHNISPDIVVQIDEKVLETEKLINSFENFNFLNESLFILSASVPEIILETFKKEKIFFIEDRTRYKTSNIYLQSASVGESAYALSLLFNASQTYLLGLDFALSDDGLTHAKDHHLSSKLDTSTVSELQKSASLSESTVYVKGNFKELVTTTPLLAMSIPILDKYTYTLKAENQDVYNLCDGAYFQNTIPLHVEKTEKFKPLNKKSLSSKLKSILDSSSEAKVSQIEINKLDQRKQQIQEYRDLLIDFAQASSSNDLMFIQSFITLIQRILDSSKTELHEIMSLYFLTISSYITDLFNTKELNNQKKHTKKMKKIITMQIEKIIKPYESELLKVVEEK